MTDLLTPLDFADEEAVCRYCGSWLMPVGDHRYAVCSKALEDKCDEQRLVPCPGERVCLYKAIWQSYPSAKYNRKHKAWEYGGRLYSISSRINLVQCAWTFKQDFETGILLWCGTLGLHYVCPLQIKEVK